MQDKASKCRQHPGTAAVAECEACGIPLCLRCSVPVRGQVFGVECLPEDLQVDLPPAAPTRRDRVLFTWTGAGATIAVTASALSWKRGGMGSGAFGAWSPRLPWARLSGVAAITCLVLWALVSIGGLRPGKTWKGALRAIAVLIGAGAVLHVRQRSGFGPDSVGPWVALAGAAVALTGTFIGRGTTGPPPDGIPGS